MNDEIIDVEAVEEKVVRCPKCGQRNRLYRQRKGGRAYRCARCRTGLQNPFIGWRPSRKQLEIAGAVLGVLFCLSVIAWKVYKWRKITAANPTAPVEAMLGPMNGTILRNPEQPGTGTLSVNDTLDTDAVIKIVKGTNADTGTVMSFYVQQHRVAKARGIPPGRYHVLFATGSHWDGLLDTFTKDDLYYRFDREFDYTADNVQGDLTLGNVGPQQAHFSAITKIDFGQ